MHQLAHIRTLAIAALALGSGFNLAAQEVDPNEGAESVAGKTCYVSKFKFENEGAYQLDLFRVGNYDFSGILSQGKSRTWDIAKAGVANGAVVFLTYRMDKGNSFKRKSCEKNGTTLLYHPDGNTWGYWSKGSTRYNNRCRFRNNTCITSVD